MPSNKSGFVRDTDYIAPSSSSTEQPIHGQLLNRTPGAWFSLDTNGQFGTLGTKPGGRQRERERAAREVVS
jgi:hypothetical protein